MRLPATVAIRDEAVVAARADQSAPARSRNHAAPLALAYDLPQVRAVLPPPVGRRQL